MKKLYFNDIFDFLKENNLSLALDLDICYYNKHISLNKILSLKRLSDYAKLKIYLYKYCPSFSELKRNIPKINNNTLNIILYDNNDIFTIYSNIYSFLSIYPSICETFLQIILKDNKPNYLIKL